MKPNRSLTFMVSVALVAQPALAEDDPAAAAKAQTDLLAAQTAQINAETAQINAKAARDKAEIDRLGLPHFDNKTTLGEGGGAIETAMLSTRAVSGAAQTIFDQVHDHCTKAMAAAAAADAAAEEEVAVQIGDAAPMVAPKIKIIGANGAKPADKKAAKTIRPAVVVLAGDQRIDLNAGRVVTARLNYFIKMFPPDPDEDKARLNETFFTNPIAVASAVAGLFGNETTVSGVALPEVDDQILANAVAGKLKGCAVLPSAGAGIIDIDNDPIGDLVTKAVAGRNRAQLLVNHSKAKQGTFEARYVEQLKASIDEFDAFYKGLGAIGEDGQSPLMRAIIADRIATTPGVMLLRVAVNRSGGTITNSKNIGTFFGGDPVRVSGGLVASFVLVDAASGTVLEGGSMACQTAQARLRDVQSGKWKTRSLDNQTQQGKAVCSM